MARRKSSLDPLFDEEPQSRDWTRYALIGGIVVIVGFIIYAAFAGRDEPQGPMPVIRADETAWTREPSEAGGMEIPNQDSTVFELMEKKDDEIATDTAATDTEAPPSEETLNKPADKSVDGIVKEIAGETEDKPVDSALETTVDNTVQKDESDIIGGIITETADKTVEKPVEAPVIGSENKTVEKPVAKAVNTMDEPFNPKAAAKTETTAPVEAKPASGSKTVQVRLGSVPGSDKAAAAGEYNRLKGLAGGAMGGNPSYEPVTLDGKGSFVRINVSMDKDAATKLCDVLSSKGAPCLILNP